MILSFFPRTSGVACEIEAVFVGLGDLHRVHTGLRQTLDVLIKFGACKITQWAFVSLTSFIHFIHSLPHSHITTFPPFRPAFAIRPRKHDI